MKCTKTCSTSGGMSKHYKIKHPITPGEATTYEDEEVSQCSTTAEANQVTNRPGAKVKPQQVRFAIPIVTNLPKDQIKESEQSLLVTTLQEDHGSRIDVQWQT